MRVLDPSTDAPGPLLLDAATLGYGISAWAAGPSGRAVFFAEHSDYSYTVECYDPEAGVASAAVYGPTFDWLTNPEVDPDGRAWIPVRSFSGPSGLVVIDTATCETVTTAPIGTILPPYKVAFF